MLIKKGGANLGFAVFFYSVKKGGESDGKEESKEL